MSLSFKRAVKIKKKKDCEMLRSLNNGVMYVSELDKKK